LQHILSPYYLDLRPPSAQAEDDSNSFESKEGVQVLVSGGSRKKYLGGLAPHHLGGNHG